MTVVAMCTKIVILILMTASMSKSQEEFDCKPKDGCQFAKCDPTPFNSLSDAVKRNEYPITCLQKKKESQSSNDLIGLYLANSDAITALTKKTDSHQEELESMRKTVNTINLQNANLVAEIARLKKCNCDPALQCTGEKIPSGTSSSVDTCTIKVNDQCFFVSKFDQKVIFPEARDACDVLEASIATIGSVKMYHVILQYMKGITNGKPWTLWYGNAYNPLNGQYQPNNYIKWTKRSFGRSNAAKTNLVLSWNSDLDHGMGNVDPSYKHSDRVLCKLNQ